MGEIGQGGGAGDATRPDAREQISGFLFALILVDENLTIKEANPAAEDLLGSSASRLCGKDLGAIVDFGGHPVIQRLQDKDAKIVARGMPATISGNSRLINITVSPLLTHPEWRVVTLSDTGQDDMRDADEPNTSLQAPAVLAHEIKNPLAAIRGAGQLLSRNVGEKDKKLTAVISSEVDRIASLIDRMQELGSSQTQPSEPVNLHQSVRNAIATVRVAARDRAEIIEEFDPSLPDVEAHREAFEQVLINLLSNAVDASALSENPTVSVRTRFVSGLAANVWRFGRSTRLPIEIAVIDNGPGPDEALGDHIFEPFVTSKPSGQGLGLALVKKLIGDMGGRVSFKRDEAKGLTYFRIHLARAEQRT